MATIVTRAGKGAPLTHNEMDSNFLNLNAALVPVGSTVVWWTPTPPDSSWLLCEAQALSTVDYPELFSVIGYTYGGSGSTFYLPETRGFFLRGWDHGAGRDPDSASRLNRGDGITGNNVGTRQTDQLRSHRHGYYDNVTTGGGSGPSRQQGEGLRYTEYFGGNETRPVNIYSAFIIKAKAN